MKNLLNDNTNRLISEFTRLAAGGLTDAIGIMGVLVLCYGFGQIYPPLMYIIGGAIMIFVAFSASAPKGNAVQQVE